jgi:hypothetical protein
MFQWLTNNGHAFYEPLAGSTNYLSAYDSFGELRRVSEGRDTPQDGQSKGQNAGRRGTQEDSSERDKQRAIPPETNRDLMPFPQNNRFLSQPVLSEELREEVWERVMRLGRSVRTVSAELGISMERVGAVVRLKEIEKEWERIVSFTYAFPPIFPRQHDEFKIDKSLRQTHGFTFYAMKRSESLHTPRICQLLA